MKEIKFRAYFEGKFWHFTLNEIIERAATYQGDWDIKALRAEKQQYTGLKDSKGVEIYEGDILKALKHNEDLFTEEVVWRAGILWFGNWNWIEFQNIFRQIEVIGNKYEGIVEDKV